MACASSPTPQYLAQGQAHGYQQSLERPVKVGGLGAWMNPSKWETKYGVKK